MPQQQELTKIVVDATKASYLHELSRLNVDSLKLLAELSRKPGVEEKLKKNATTIKMFL